jgi:small-conductance mechanosensitive channel
VIVEFLDEVWLGNSVQTWIVAAVIVVAVFVALSLLKPPLLRYAKRFSSTTETLFDDLFAALIDKTKTWFLLALSVLAGATVLRLPADADSAVQMVVIVLALIQGGIWGNIAIFYGLGRMMKSRMEDDASAITTLAAITLLTKIILWAVVLLLMLDNVGIDITALIAGLGVGGIAVALAAQNVLADLFASMSIVFDKPFVLGDFIIVGDKAGTVEHIGLKTTRVRALSGEQLVFSNTQLLSSEIRNFKRMEERRVVFTVGVVYQAKAEQLERIPQMIREIVEAQDKVRFDRSHFAKFGDFSLDFETVYYMAVPDYNEYMDTQQAINLALFRKFEGEGIEFAYPTQTLYVAREAEGEQTTTKRAA